MLFSPLVLSDDFDSGKSRKIRSLAFWYLTSFSSLDNIILSLAGVASVEEPARSPSFPLSLASDVALERPPEPTALPSREGLLRRMIFIGGAVGGGVALLAAYMTDNGVGLYQ